MNDSGVFLTIAEVAAAFAGFSALASVVSRAEGRAPPRISSLRLQGVLEMSLLVVLLALLPYVPDRLGASADLTWMVSSVLFLVTWLLSAVAGNYRAQKNFQEAGLRLFTPVYVPLFWGVSAVPGVVLVPPLLGFWGGPSSGLYLLALVALLVAAGLSFLRFFVGVQPEG